MLLSCVSVCLDAMLEDCPQITMEHFFFPKRSPVSLLTPSVTPARQLLLPKSLKRDMWSLQFDLLTIK